MKKIEPISLLHPGINHTIPFLYHILDEIHYILKDRVSYS